MCPTTSDLVPQSSGSASIGVNQIGVAGFGNPVPYNHIHLVSGIWHDPTNGEPSGIIRFSVNNEIQSISPPNNASAFQFSCDGGISFPLELGVGRKSFANGPVIRSRAGDLHILSSGAIRGISEQDLIFTTINGGMVFETNSPDNFGDMQFLARNSLQFISEKTNIIFDTLADDTGGQIELNAFASSGRLQYRFGPHQGWAAKLTHSSTGGPAGDGFWPLPHSGQVAAMIAQATPGGSVDLQTAYDNGNEIDHRKDLIGYKGIVVRETIPGLDGFSNNEDIRVNKPGKYGIAVSGFTLTPTNVNSYGFSALNALSLVISSSGTPSILSRNFFLGYAGSNPTAFFNTNGSLQFAVGDPIGSPVGLGGQLSFRPFGGSGRLEYRFGPHQGWAERLTHASTGGPANDGFWPLPNSGQMLEQIVRREKSKSITIERPAVNNDLTWFYTNQAITITEVESVVRGTADASGSFAIRYAANRSLAGTELTATAITCVDRTIGQITTSFAAANIPVDNWVWIAVSGVSGVATSQLGVTMHFN